MESHAKPTSSGEGNLRKTREKDEIVSLCLGKQSLLQAVDEAQDLLLLLLCSTF